MSQGKSEILFNKKNLKTLIQKSQGSAKIIHYLLEESCIHQRAENASELVNLYTKRLNSPSQALTRKILLNDFKPFEFLVNKN
jgi:hypothetical protein